MISGCESPCGLVRIVGLQGSRIRLALVIYKSMLNHGWLRHAEVMCTRVILFTVIFFIAFSVKEYGEDMVDGSFMFVRGHLLPGVVDPSSMPYSSLFSGKFRI